MSKCQCSKDFPEEPFAMLSGMKAAVLQTLHLVCDNTSGWMEQGDVQNTQNNSAKEPIEASKDFEDQEQSS